MSAVDFGFDLSVIWSSESTTTRAVRTCTRKYGRFELLRFHLEVVMGSIESIPSITAPSVRHGDWWGVSFLMGFSSASPRNGDCWGISSLMAFLLASPRYAWSSSSLPFLFRFVRISEACAFLLVFMFIDWSWELGFRTLDDKGYRLIFFMLIDYSY